MSDIRAKIIQRTHREGSCLIWDGSRNPAGYGKIRFKGKLYYVHRLLWETDNGAIPEGMMLDHICERKSCINGAHLRLATNKQNTENITAPQVNNRSGYRGVTKFRHKYQAHVGHHGTHYYFGTFDTPEEAAEAARLGRIQLFTHNESDRHRP